MKELWKPISNFEGLYEVSNLGNVKSLNYLGVQGVKHILTPILKQKNKNKYYVVILYKNGKRYEKSISRMVAEAFIPKIDKNKNDIVVYISDNTLDNSVENLMWTTYGEYRKQLHKKGLIKSQKGIYRKTKNSIDYNGKNYKSLQELVDDYNINLTTFTARLKYGWTFEEALKEPIGTVLKNLVYGKKYEYYNKKLTASQLSKISNISVRTFNSRLERGWNIYEASEIPVGIVKTKNAKEFIYKNKVFKGLKEISNHFNINIATLEARLYVKKWSLEKAIEIPVKNRKVKE